MKDYKFYLEHASPKDKRKGKNTGNVIVVHSKSFFSTSICKRVVLATAPIDNTPNTPNIDKGKMLELKYIKKNCTRIGEEEARTHHPNLFVRLEHDIKNYS
jgi:hypothetical protein